MWLQKPPLGTQLDRSDSFNNPVLDLLFNEGHGNIVNDLSGWGNHGTLHGFDFPPTVVSGWNPGMDGVALAFDGSDDYIDCGNKPSLSPTNAIAFEIDIFFNRVDIGQDFFSKGQYYTLGNSWCFEAQLDGSLAFSIERDVVNSGSGYLVSNKWYRIIVTFDQSLPSNNIKMFVNGVLIGSASRTSSIPVTSDPVQIGCGTAGNFTNAKIDRARILPRAMSALEVMQTQINPYGVYQR